jgi:hypothetical protein
MLLRVWTPATEAIKSWHVMKHQSAELIAIVVGCSVIAVCTGSAQQRRPATASSHQVHCDMFSNMTHDVDTMSDGLYIADQPHDELLVIIMRCQCG